MLAAVFSNVSKETLGVYRGGGEEAADGECDDVGDMVVIVCGDDGGKLSGGERRDSRDILAVTLAVSVDDRIRVGAEFESRLTMGDDHDRPTDAAAADLQQGGTGDDKGKNTETEESASTSAPPDAADGENGRSSPDSENDDTNKGKSAASGASSGAWQAIYSPQYNTYYFYNAETQETTWTNPLQSAEPAASTSTSQEPDAQDAAAFSSIDPRYVAMRQAAVAQGIDPALAYLDPSLGAPMPSAAVGPDGMSFAAKFNARTGQFTRPDGRDPTHLSEYDRMKRMSQFYFDVGAWEEQLSEQGGSIKGDEATKKRKRPSKKDLVSTPPFHLSFFVCSVSWTV